MSKCQLKTSVLLDLDQINTLNKGKIMPITAQDLNSHLRKVSEGETLLDMLLEFESVLDEVDLYAYKNWIKGEILEGPDLGRHWITTKFMYMSEDMPDPAGAQRLLSRGIKVKYTRDELKYPKKIENWDDVDPDQSYNFETGGFSSWGGLGSVGYVKPKVLTDNVWIVEIAMPRKYVDSSMGDHVEIDDENFVDTDAINTNTQIQADAQMNAEPQPVMPSGEDI
jgi:hypothetical protein